MVALLSDSYSRRSDRAETLKDVTSGPPALPVPVRYSFMPVGSRTSGVLSKETPPSRLKSKSESSLKYLGSLEDFAYFVELAGLVPTIDVSIDPPDCQLGLNLPISGKLTL